MKIFIVDDSELIRDRIISLVSDIPQIQVAGQTGSKIGAVKKIRDVNPDVVILDIRIKDGNGIEILEELKKDQSSPKVIMLTQHPYPQYRKKCLEAGADNFFDKSTEFEKVADAIEQLLLDTGGQYDKRIRS